MYKREISLDYIKGILILLVVYGHCLYWFDGNQYSSNYFVAKIIYTFHMPFFIFLSGYFFSNKINNNIYSTIIVRFKRLIIPHFFFNIIMIMPIFYFWEVYGHFITRFSNGTITISSVYHYLTMFWFLWCVFISSIITNIVYIYTKDKKKGDIILFLISILFLLISKKQIIHIFIDHQHLGTMFIFFAFGVIIHDHICLFTHRHTKCCSILLYVIYLAIISFFPEKDYFIISEIGSLAGFICAYNLFLLLFNLKWGVGYFLFVSRWTLSIYIYHFAILYAIMKFVNEFYKNFNSAFIILMNLFIAISVTYAIAIITVYLSKSAFLRKYAFGNK